MLPTSYIAPPGSTLFNQEAHALANPKSRAVLKNIGEGVLNSVSFGTAGSVHGAAGDFGVALGTVIGLVVDPFAAAGAIGKLTARLAEVVGDFRAAKLSNSAIDDALHTRGFLTGKAAAGWQAAKAARLAAAAAKIQKATLRARTWLAQSHSMFGAAAVARRAATLKEMELTDQFQARLADHEENLIPKFPISHFEVGRDEIPDAPTSVGVHETKLNGETIKTGDMIAREFKPTPFKRLNTAISKLNNGKQLSHVATYIGKVKQTEDGRYVPHDNGQHAVVEHWGAGGKQITIKHISQCTMKDAKIDPKEFGFTKVANKDVVARLAARERGLAVVGKGSYRASVENCQHVASYIATGKAESPEALRIARNVGSGAARISLTSARLASVRGQTWRDPNRAAKRRRVGPSPPRPPHPHPHPGPPGPPGPTPGPDPNPRFGGVWSFRRKKHRVWYE